ncbi:MAG: hypothetical protein ACODAD_03510, partial [Planctomycetota bacterium]
WAAKKGAVSGDPWRARTLTFCSAHWFLFCLQDPGRIIFQAVGFFRVESCPTQAVLPLVGLATEKVIRDRYTLLTPA